VNLKKETVKLLELTQVLQVKEKTIERPAIV